MLKGTGAAVVSAMAFAASTGLGVIWPLAWLAPIPVLLMSFQRSRRASALIAFSAYFLGSLALLGLFRLGGLIIFAVPPAIGFALATLAARSAARRLPVWLAVFVFPSAWTSYEFLYSRISLNGTYWSLGYSQTDFLPLLQIVSFTGLWGVIFLLMLLPSAVALSWHRRSVSAFIPSLVILVAVLGYGTVRLWREPEPSVRAGLTASDSVLAATSGGTSSQNALTIARAYADEVTRLAADGAEIIVLPEKLVGVTPDEADAVMKVFSDASLSARVTLIVGLSRTGVSPLHNVAIVFSPAGQLISEYEKHHLVPLVESAFANGETPQLFSGPAGRWGVAICKDMDFPGWSREYGLRGARFLAVPALDFVKDGRMHSRMAVTRGVENGFAVARAAGQGVVTFSDAYGRVLAEQSSATEPAAHQVHRLAAGPGATFYTRYGDWFGWASVVGLCALLAFAFMTAPRSD